MLIYRISNKLNGNCYIGQTSKSVYKRFAQHSNLNARGKRSAIKAAIQKYGKDNFTILILGEYETAQDLNNAEEYFIDFYNCLAPNGYNLTTGGYPRRPAEEIRLAMLGNTNGKGNKGRKGAAAWNKGLPGLGGEKHPMFGKHHTKEANIKNSLAHKGRPSANKGKKASPELKLKLSLAHLGKKPSEETKKKMSLSHQKRLASK